MFDEHNVLRGYLPNRLGKEILLTDEEVRWVMANVDRFRGGGGGGNVWLKQYQKRIDFEAPTDEQFMRIVRVLKDASFHDQT